MDRLDEPPRQASSWGYSSYSRLASINADPIAAAIQYFSLGVAKGRHKHGAVVGEKAGGLSVTSQQVPPHHNPWEAASEGWPFNLSLRQIVRGSTLQMGA